MKVKLLFSILLVITAMLSNSVKAQECSLGPPGTNICTPNQNLTVVGFYPPYDSVSCVLDGVYFDTVIQFHAPSSSQGATVNYIQVTDVLNLPCGLCWSMGDANNEVQGGQSGCVRVAGVTYDAPGQYNLKVYANISATEFLFTVTLMGVNIDSLTGLKYFVRVGLPGGSCITIDTLAAGNTASVPGAITTPAISGNNSFCPGSSTTLTAGGANYYGYVWSTGALTSSINVTTAGTYTVTVYDNCASATASTTVTETAGPPVIITPATTSVCFGSSVTLTASGANSYSWSNSQNTASITVSPTSQTTYTVTAIAGGNCSASASRTLTVNTPPSPAISASSDTICGGAGTTLTARGGVSYRWNNSVATAANTVSPAGTTTYIVTVTDANTCTATASNTVTVKAVPVTISGNGPTTLCTGDSIVLTTDTTFVAYHWNVNAITRTIDVSTPGIYVVTVTGSNGCDGVSNAITVTVGSNLSPRIVVNPSLDICPGANTTLDAGSGFNSYAWSNSSTGESINVTSAAIYSVTVTSGSCSGSASAQVNVGNFPAPVNIFPAGPVTVCAGDTVSLDAGPGYSSYSWSTGGADEILQPDTSGSYIVTVTKNFCVGSDTVQVTFKPLPVPVITPAGPLSKCTGDSVSLDAGAGFASYLWSNGWNSETTQPTNSGLYSITVTQNGCTGVSTPVSVTFNTFPMPAITPAGNQNVCSGHTITLDAGAGYSAYLWSNGDTTETTSIDSAGTYNVTVTQNGCKGSSPNPSMVTANTTPVATLRNGGSANGFAVLEAGPSIATFTWLLQQSPNGFYSSTNAQGSLDTVTCLNNAAYYRVIASLNGCSDTSSQIEVVCSGINDISALVSFNIHPNPASDVLNVTYELNTSANIKLAVIDLTGRKITDVVNEFEAKGNHLHQVKLNDLSSGIYLLNFVTEQGSFNTKFVKQ